MKRDKSGRFIKSKSKRGGYPAKFSDAKIIMRKIAKRYKLKDKADWIRFTKTAAFKKYNLPKKPWDYYSKEKVWARMKKSRR